MHNVSYRLPRTLRFAADWNKLATVARQARAIANSPNTTSHWINGQIPDASLVCSRVDTSIIHIAHRGNIPAAKNIAVAVRAAAFVGVIGSPLRLQI
jgi:hypothetical protein